jgi:hypothetical protein
MNKTKIFLVKHTLIKTANKHLPFSSKRDQERSNYFTKFVLLYSKCKTYKLIYFYLYLYVNIKLLYNILYHKHNNRNNLIKK